MNNIFLSIKILFCRIFESPLFIIKIENGQPVKVMGLVKSGFMADCQDIANRNQLNTGLVYAIKDQSGNKIVKASGGISKDVLQQLRNAFNF